MICVITSPLGVIRVGLMSFLLSLRAMWLTGINQVIVFGLLPATHNSMRPLGCRLVVFRIHILFRTALFIRVVAIVSMLPRDCWDAHTRTWLVHLLP